MKPNDIIGAYTLVEKLGKGNYQVWKAEKKQYLIGSREYALKFISEDEVDESVLEQEVRLWHKASEYHCENIAAFVDAERYEDGEDRYLVIISEYASEGSLQARINERRLAQQPFTSEEIKQILSGIVSGLQHLHSDALEIVHRDLKPANVVFKRGIPKIIDFGISRIFTSESMNSHLPKGTPHYMAPEAFLGERTPQVDIWAVGVILYQLLTQELPFPSDPLKARNFGAIQLSITSEQYRPLPDNIPAAYVQIIDKCLQKMPINRYASVEEMREAIGCLPALSQDEPPAPVDFETASLSNIDSPSEVTHIPTPSPPLPLSVEPDDGASPEITPFPVEGPRVERRPIPKFVFYGLGVLLALIAGGLLIKWFLNRNVIVTPPAPTPIKLKLATYWRSDLPILADNVRKMAEDINTSAKGELEIQVLFAGDANDANGNKIEPRDLFDAVSNNRVQMVHSAPYYWETKIKGAAFFSSVPFGMYHETMDSWIQDGGGLDLWRELYKPYHVIPFACGHTGPQMGGWFNREIRTTKDFNGIKMRIPGLGGKVLEREGATTISVPPQDILAYGESGKIDAAESIGPYHDYKLQLYNAWRYYYGPGWQEHDAMFELMINEDVYNKLPPKLKQLIESKAREYNGIITNQFVTLNKQYVSVLRKKNVVFRKFPQSVLNKLQADTNIVLKEYDGGSTKKIYDSYRAFQQSTPVSAVDEFR